MSSASQEAPENPAKATAGNSREASELVSVVLVNWNTRALTDAAIKSFRSVETSTPLEFIIVDNASTDNSVEYFKEHFPDARLIRSPVNEGFARGNNRGVQAATGRYVLLLNTDTVSHEEVLPQCLAALKAHGPAIVGCRLLNTDGSLQFSAGKFPRLRDLASEMLRTSDQVHSKNLAALPPPGAGPAPIDWLCGAFLLVERETYQRLGGLSSEIFMYGEDVEFCWRAAQNGIASLYLPDVALTHLGGGGINHGSFRSLMNSDAGRLRSFALMRGQAAAFFLRLIFLTRSSIRFFSWGIPGIVAGDAGRRQKAKNHGLEILELAGLRFKRG